MFVTREGAANDRVPLRGAAEAFFPDESVEPTED
mgnify:CR=1 FL=1